MSALIVRTDDILTLSPEDIGIVEDAGMTYAQRPSATEAEVIRNAAGAQGLLVLAEPITEAVMDALPDLKVIARFGVGLDTVDVPAATARGIRVVYVPDANTTEVASHAFALIMALVRRLPHLDTAVRDGVWSYREGGDGVRRIDGLRLGVVGFGRTGRLVARYGKALGFQVVAADPFATTTGDDAVPLLPLDEVLTTSDVVSLHVPLSAGTRNLVNAEVVARMRPHAIIVNTSRGGLVDEAAVAEAVREGRLAGAGFDAVSREPIPADSPLLGVPGIIITPHAAHYSVQSYQETIQRAIRDAVRVIAGDEPHDPAN